MVWGGSGGFSGRAAGLCQAVLPYSNWQWATRCQSESLLSLRAGLQAALFRLGKVPKLLQITAARPRIKSAARGNAISIRSSGRWRNMLAEHYGLAVRTIHVGCPNENGDVEAHNGYLKRRLEQHLLLRGYRDFASEAAYDQFVAAVLTRANSPRTAKVAEELAVLPPTRRCEHD